MTPRYSPDSARLDRIKTWMQSYVDERKFAGSSVLITQSGEELFFHATGQRDVDRDLPFVRDTSVRIYSMTKPITSVAIMMLVERGLFHLDAPLSDFLPEFSNMRALIPNASQIDQSEPCATPTLHQLMTHTSGLSYPFNPGVLPRAMDEVNLLFKPDQGDLATVTRQLAEFPLAFHPGKHWEYSVGIDVLGRVIEVASGKTLANFFADEILAPLSMKSSGFTVPQGTGDQFAALYTSLPGDELEMSAVQMGSQSLRMVDQNESSPFHATTTYSGGGGLISTIDDYMKFAEMLRLGGACEGGRLLSSATLDFMRRNHLPGDIASMGPTSFAEQPMDGMGFGLGGAVVLDPARARCPGSVGDFSWGGMASTFFWQDPVLDLNVVFLTQLVPSSSYPARSQLKALIHGAMMA